MRRVKWGIVGSGGIAERRTIPGLLKCENAELAACMDRDGNAARRVADQFGAKLACTDLGELLAAELDAVYIATPVFAHEEQARAALAAGKHVLVEKPLAMNAGSAASLVESFREKNLLLMAGYMMRYHNLHGEMKRILSEGGIGTPVSADLQFSCWYPRVPGSWRQVRAKGGGGAVMDLGVHCLDLLSWLTDAKVKEVKAFCANQVQDYEVEDGANILLTLENGILARVQVNFNVPDALPSRVELKGTAGALVAEGTLGQTESGSLTWLYAPQKSYDAAQNNPEPRKTVFPGGGGDIYAKQVADFSRRVLDKNFDCSFAESSVEVQRLVQEIYRNSEEGK